MRRKEFEITDKNEIEGFLNGQDTGVLSYSTNTGMPCGIPMSYVYRDGRIYMHSGPQGEKMSNISGGLKVMFTVFKEYSYIPPHFIGKTGACNASRFYKSVMISGHLEFVNEVDMKILMLDRLMEKFQPEGRYDKMEIGDMSKMIGATVVIAIVPEKITGKFKFGQNLNDELIEMIIKNLLSRNSSPDIETVEMIKKFRKNLP